MPRAPLSKACARSDVAATVALGEEAWSDSRRNHGASARGAPSWQAGTTGGSVANYRKQESSGSEVIDFPIHDFWILPRKSNFATELVCSTGAPRPMKSKFTRQPDRDQLPAPEPACRAHRGDASPSPNGAGCPSPTPAPSASRRWRASERGELPGARGETCVYHVAPFPPITRPCLSNSACISCRCHRDKAHCG